MLLTVRGQCCFDETNMIPQAFRPMRVIGFLLALACAGGSAVAQTNANTAAAPNVRYISLMDCLQMALEKNLALRISRYTVPQARLNLMLAYAGYDPTFGFGYLHTYSLTGGGLDPTTHLPTPGTSLDANNFNMSLLNGLTPWGTTYDIRGTLSESYGALGAGSGTNAFTIPTD